MITQILEIFKSENRPLCMDELSNKIAIERSALEGMIDYLVIKGRLIELQANGRRDKKNTLQTCGGCHGNPLCAATTISSRYYSIKPKDN